MALCGWIVTVCTRCGWRARNSLQRALIFIGDMIPEQDQAGFGNSRRRLPVLQLSLNWSESEFFCVVPVCPHTQPHKPRKGIGIEHGARGLGSQGSSNVAPRAPAAKTGRMCPPGPGPRAALCPPCPGPRAGLGQGALLRGPDPGRRRGDEGRGCAGLTRGGGRGGERGGSR